MSLLAGDHATACRPATGLGCQLRRRSRASPHIERRSRKKHKIAQMNIRPVNLADAPQIAEIYNYYIETSVATFETETVTVEEMKRRIIETLAGNYPFSVAEESGEIVGYSYGRQFRPRAAYQRSVEVSVYLMEGVHGRGVATTLYEHLFPQIAERGFNTIIAGISLPNEASVRLHEKFGMKKTAHFKEIGYKFGKWIDTGYWQLVLND